MIKDYRGTVVELLEKYSNDTRVLDIKISSDDGGPMIDIVVDNDTFGEIDDFPRKYNDIPVCVLRKHKLGIKLDHSKLT